MENKKINLNFGTEAEPRIASLPIRVVSFKTSDEVARIKFSWLDEYDMIGLEFEGLGVADAPLSDSKDILQLARRNARVALCDIKHNLEIAKVIVDSSKLEGEDADKIATQDFWNSQDYVNEIRPAVDFFREKAGL